MIDTLFANLSRAAERDTLKRLSSEPGRYGLVTLHRPANVDEPGMLKGLVGALGDRHPLLPGPARPPATGPGPGDDGDPGRRDRHRSSRLPRLRGRGGQRQRGANRLGRSPGGDHRPGVPCLTLRETTERPITITEGTNVLVGCDPSRIVAEALRVVRDGVPARRPALWDGRAGERIADVLVDDTRPRR